MSITHELTQGSAEWIEFRKAMFGASEAAAMLGLSSKVSRNELLHMKKTGAAQEFSDWVQVNILDNGHAVEALARPLVEQMLGEELFPVTMSNGRLSASCDGLTMDEETAFEHKQWNEALAASVAACELPEEHMPQCQQIMMVAGAKKVIFVVSDGTPEKLVWMAVHQEVEWFDRIRAGWNQFEKDLAEYEHVEILPAAVAAPVQDLPALSIRVDGHLALNHNLVIFGEKLTKFIADINKAPDDDQGFADAEQAMKVMKRAEEALGAAEASALGQISTVDEMVKTVASYKELARKTRLMLEKMVTARKETIRVEIHQAAKDKAAEHIATLNTRLGKTYMPTVAVDLAGVMKNKRTISSLRNAVDTELARFKIEANEIADRIQINLGVLRELGSSYTFLFADTAQIVLKAADDLTALVKLRIADHERAEAEKAEALRSRIAEEECIKAERAAAETIRLAQAEADRVAEESAAAERQRVQADTKRQLEEQAASIAAAHRVSAPVVAIMAAEPDSVQFVLEQAPPSIPTSLPLLRLGQIGERLGFSLTADFLRKLGFEPAGRDKAAVLYHECDFPSMCAALIRHINLMSLTKGKA